MIVALQVVVKNALVVVITLAKASVIRLALKRATVDVQQFAMLLAGLLVPLHVLVLVNQVVAKPVKRVVHQVVLMKTQTSPLELLRTVQVSMD